MKDKVILNNLGEINYIRQLIERDVKMIELNLESRQKLLQQFNDRSGK